MLKWGQAFVCGVSQAAGGYGDPRIRSRTDSRVRSSGLLTGFPDPDLFDHFAYSGRRLLPRPVALGLGSPCYQTTVAVAGVRYSSCLLSIAQASLLANATAATPRGLCAIILAGQEVSGTDFRPSQFNRDNAPRLQ